MPSPVLEAADLKSQDLQSLEEKIYRTIELLKSAREAKSTAERDAKRARAQMEERGDEYDHMKAELVALRKEREEVRTRVEKLLKQIDALTAAEAEA
jgi:chromosome segregation ATPase